MADPSETSRNESLRLPRYAWTYVEQLKADFIAVTEGQAAKDHRELFENPPSTWTWADMYFLEAAILRVEPADNLRRVAWRWRLRFRNTAGPVAYRLYLASQPPDPATAKIDDLRSDLGSLAAELHYLYVLVPARDEARDRFYLLSFGGGAAALLSIVVVVSVRGSGPHLPVLLLAL